MIEEIKHLTEALANLPNLTVWVLAGFLLYKLATIGSVYGLLHLAIVKLHDWLAHRHEYKQVRPLIDSVCISGSAEQLGQILKSLAERDKSDKHRGRYLWPDDVSWLAEAINEKKQRDAEAKK